MKLLSILILLLLASPAWGATYYMRADGTAANKGAANSPNAAATAMSVATHNGETFSAGDIIELSSQGGTFSARIVPPTSGVTYKNVTGETPTITVRDTVTGFAQVGETSVYKATYAHAADTVYQDNVPLQKNNDASVTAGQFYSDEADLYIYGDPTGTTITASQGYYVGCAFYLDNKSDIEISGNILIEYTANAVYSTASTGDVSGIVVNGLTFRYCYDAFLSLTLSNDYSSSGQFSNNTIYRSNSVFRAYSEYGTKYIGANSWTVSGNTGADIGTTNGTTLWNENAAIDRDFVGIQNSQTSLFYSNVSNGGDVICFNVYTLNGGESNATSIYKNLCSQNNNRFLIISGEGTWTNNSIKVFANIHYDDYALTTVDLKHCSLYLDKPASVTTGTTVYNNTLVGSEIGIFLYSGGTGGATGYVFKNNIVVGASSYSFMAWNEVPLLEWTSDYNVYDWQDALPFYYNDGAYNLSDFKTNTGQDAHSLASDPILNAAYGIEGDSPAKDKGAVLYPYAAHPGDYYSRKIYGAGPDIGAVEYEDHTPGGWFFEMFTSLVMKLCASTNAACYTQAGAPKYLTIESEYVAIAGEKLDIQ